MEVELDVPHGQVHLPDPTEVSNVTADRTGIRTRHLGCKVVDFDLLAVG